MNTPNGRQVGYALIQPARFSQTFTVLRYTSTLRSLFGGIGGLCSCRKLAGFSASGAAFPENEPLNWPDVVEVADSQGFA